MPTVDELYMVGWVNLQSWALKEAVGCFKKAADKGLAPSQYGKFKIIEGSIYFSSK